MATVRDHRNPQRPQLRTVPRLGYVHPLDRTGSPRPSIAVHPHRQLRPGQGAQRDLPVDPGRRAPSIALRRLPHAQQRVAPAPQHQLLQVPERAQVPIPRRREDPLPQPPYVVLVAPPVDGVPAQGIARRSVHHEVSNLPSDSDGIDQHPLHSSPAHVSAPFGARAPRLGIRPVIQQRPPWRSSHDRCGFPVGFRPPAFASWASCSRQQDSAIPYGWPTGRLIHRPQRRTVR